MGYTNLTRFTLTCIQILFLYVNGYWTERAESIQDEVLLHRYRRQADSYNIGAGSYRYSSAPIGYPDTRYQDRSAYNSAASSRRSSYTYDYSQTSYSRNASMNYGSDSYYEAERGYADSRNTYSNYQYRNSSYTQGYNRGRYRKPELTCPKCPDCPPQCPSTPAPAPALPPSPIQDYQNLASACDDELINECSYSSAPFRCTDDQCTATAEAGVKIQIFAPQNLNVSQCLFHKFNTEVFAFTVCQRPAPHWQRYDLSKDWQQIIDCPELTDPQCLTISNGQATVFDPRFCTNVWSVKQTIVLHCSLYINDDNGNPLASTALEITVNPDCRC
ncbi:uncharacterized protein LOC129589903 [Paramacrobiotus metropolitanus]|uniref:uncharacterized protein LOC129589903 n=1 Tax=Paramacrobiotus metropolitanus TaxID=2943436 RepID=UPI0024457D12|nr:uncharacterized protein LOC129589903 [Paramacrobiotus metropolitanus]